MEPEPTKKKKRTSGASTGSQAATPTPSKKKKSKDPVEQSEQVDDVFQEELPELLSLAERGDTAALVVALSSGADVAASSRAGYTALHLASAQGHADVVEQLIKSRAQAGADLHARDGSGRKQVAGQTAFELAQKGGAGKQVVEVLQKAIKATPPPTDEVHKVQAPCASAEEVWKILKRGPGLKA